MIEKLHIKEILAVKGLFGAWLEILEQQLLSYFTITLMHTDDFM